MRDSLLGLPLGDIDIAANALPKKIMEVLSPLCAVVPTGIKHGTITAIKEGTPFQITSLREDIKTDGRHAEVVYGTSFEKDAARRDFTFNALSMDRMGQIYDYFGGRDDLDAGHVRFIGDPHRRIQEDYLRILRFFRMHAYFGKDKIDENALEACQSEKSGIQNLSRERIRQEMFKIFPSPRAYTALHLMEETGVLHEVYGHSPDWEAFDRLAQDGSRIKSGMTEGTSAIIPLLTLYHNTLDSLPHAFVLTRREIQLLKNLIRYRETFFTILPHVLLYHLDTPDFKALTLILGAIHSTPTAPYLDVAKNWMQPAFPVHAEDLPHLEGKALGDALKAIEAFWIEGDFKATKKECLDFLES